MRDEDVAFLKERTRSLVTCPPRPGGLYVLYWMTTALRAEENPAFERALLAAHNLSLPLVVYHGLSARYTHASDRIHRFVLEGEAELRAGIEARGATYRFFLGRGRDDERGVLRRLADRAAAVVTDDFPTFDVARWVSRFAASASCPVLAVDASCVAPMRLIGRAYERAFEYRRAASPLWADRIRPVPRAPSPPRALSADVPLDVDDVRVEPAGIGALLASLPIDHSVPPAPDRRGGAANALGRWARFLQGPVDAYAFGRNDALNDDGVSGMSPYLHFGMVWSGRLARDALAHGGPGAAKWVDELLVWRELSWCFCFYRPDHAAVSAMPDWAREDLEARARAIDVPSSLALDRGETGDALWDAAQRRLRRDGWLHNNVRMTWGKQVAAWIRDPARALSTLLELNDRYALDGRDPSSFGGILWCFGGFDRPHERTQDLGRVRPRPTSVHAKRLPPAKYAPRDTLPGWTDREVVVVGAGVAGLACARTLRDAGYPVRIVEKSRGAGGRIATREHKGLAFDYGPTALTARGPALRRVLDMLSDEGLLAREAGPDGEVALASYVSARGLRPALARYARGVTVDTHAKVTRVSRDTDGLVVTLEDGRTLRASRVVLTAPVPQALAVLGVDSVPGAEVAYEPGLVVVVRTRAVAPVVDGLHGVGSSFVASVRARRAGEGTLLTLEATAAATDALRGASDEECVTRLLEASAPLGLGASLAADATFTHVKRWRYARAVGHAATSPPFAVAGDGVFLAGDAFACGGIEGAWVSGTAVASALIGQSA